MSSTCISVTGCCVSVTIQFHSSVRNISSKLFSCPLLLMVNRSSPFYASSLSASLLSSSSIVGCIGMYSYQLSFGSLTTFSGLDSSRLLFSQSITCISIYPCLIVALLGEITSFSNLTLHSSPLLDGLHPRIAPATWVRQGKLSHVYLLFHQVIVSSNFGQFSLVIC